MTYSYEGTFKGRAMTEKIYPALQLTDACNKRCKACLRIPDRQAHKLHFEDIERYIKDLDTLSRKYTLGFQFVTGGEPTIWKDQGKDVADVLIAMAGQGKIRSITMPTNGKRFEDKAYVEDLVLRIAAKVDQTIIMGLSIADYQENFINGRCIPLENLLDAAAKSQGKVLPIALVTLSKSDTMDKQIKASYPDVFQRVTPLAPLGAGQDMMADCPSVCLGNSLKDKIGDFFPYFKSDVTGRLKISDDQFQAMSNWDIMNKMSFFTHCGQSPFVIDRWHYCLPFREDPFYDIAPIGEMKENSLEEFIAQRPWLESIRTRGLLETVEHYKYCLTPETREKLDNMLSPGYQVSIAYRGCMVCKELAEIGVWNDIRKNAS